MENTPFRISWHSLLTPFGLVVVLTAITFLGSLAYYENDDPHLLQRAVDLALFWQDGFFSLLGFTLQMMMILVFGYALAIFQPVNLLVRKVSQLPSSIVSGALLVAAVTMLAGLFNWGFGLIIGAILARFVQESLFSKGKPSNPALLASAGYLGMGIWHGGFSGSAPLTVAGEGHFLQEKTGIIPVSDTIYSYFNFLVTGGLFFTFLLTVWLLSKKVSLSVESVSSIPMKPIGRGSSDYLARISGVIMLVVVFLGLLYGPSTGLGIISLNWVNFLLFSMTLIAFQDWNNFSKAIGEGLKASSDIFIQFPFYAGILGLLSSSGILLKLSVLLQSAAGPEIFPSIAFFSSALINLLVPSGGGQWAIQGPVILEAAKSWGLDLGKMTMIFSYGDQITNLLQPFWALPLLSITGISVRRLFPYCLILFLSGFIFLTISIWILV